MIYNDDEKIEVASQVVSEEEEAVTYDAGKTELTIINQPEAPLEETELKVLMELTGSGETEDRSPVDIVAVLDVSGSMSKENRIGKLIIAMHFLIQKLSPTDRLSIVTFSTEAKRLFRLRQITNDSQLEIIKEVDALNAGGLTNMADGLKTGVKVLKDRRFSNGRLGAIILMSDGDQTLRYGDARDVQVDNFAVHTFGFGSDAKAVELTDIANKSKGGTFSEVRDHKNLTKAFSQCLGGLLSVVVKDLNLTITQFNQESKINNVFAGNYPKTEEDTSVTISFGELYNSEVRMVMVYVLLPKVDTEKSPDVLKVAYKYSSGIGKQFQAPPVTATVNRRGKATVKEIPKLILEESRLMALNNVRKARVLADNKELKKAKDKVDGTKTTLEGVKVDDPTELIKTLIYDLQQLSSFMKTQTDYEEKGRPYALSFETSHDRQRYAARGDVDKVRSFATPRMNAYLQQAKVFDINPRMPPPKEADDVKKEQEEREKQERKEQEERKERERKEQEERKEREREEQERKEREEQKRKEQEERKERERKEQEEREEQKRKEQEEREERERKEQEEREEQKRKEQEEREAQERKERERKEQEEREELERKKQEELEEQKRKDLEKRFYFINIVNLVFNFIYNVLLKLFTGRRT